MSRPASRRIAYHEAGHAVMSVLERLPFRHVTIIPNEDHVGMVEPSDPPKDFRPELETNIRTRLRVEAMIRVRLAGEVAGGIFAGRRSWRLPVTSSSPTDFSLAMDLATCLVEVDDTLSAYLHLLYLQTRDKLRIRWNWIRVEAVAEALLRERNLSSRKVRKIMQDTLQAALKRAREER